jgi:uncharacterized protein (DUF488 family)
MNKLYTMGYQGMRGVYNLLEFAIPLDATIVDIRYQPWSQNEEWTKATLLQRLCDLQFGSLKCRYVHIKELGNLNYKTGGPIEIWLPEVGMARLDEQLKAKPCILLCRCPDVEQCHRKVVADLAVKWLGVSVEHLTNKTPMAGVVGGARPDRVIQFPTKASARVGKEVAKVEETSQSNQMSLW